MNRREFLLTVPAVAVVSAAQHGRRDAIDQQAYPPSCAKFHKSVEQAQWWTRLSQSNFARGAMIPCKSCGATFMDGRWYRHRPLTRTTLKS